MVAGAKLGLYELALMHLQERRVDAAGDSGYEKLWYFVILLRAVGHDAESYNVSTSFRAGSGTLYIEPKRDCCMSVDEFGRSISWNQRRLALI